MSLFPFPLLCCDGVDVIRSMVVCSEEGYVVYWGCRLLYNMCYRSEAGADVLLSRSTLLKVILCDATTNTNIAYLDVVGLMYFSFYRT